MKQAILIIFVCFGLLLTSKTEAQTASADNKISESITFHDMPKGKNVRETAAHHTPDFYIDDSRLDVGIKAFCNIVFDYK